MITNAFMARINKMNMCSEIGPCDIERSNKRISMFRSQLYAVSSGIKKDEKRRKTTRFQSQRRKPKFNALLQDDYYCRLTQPTAKIEP